MLIRSRRNLIRSLVVLALVTAASVMARAEPGRYLELDAFLESVLGQVPERPHSLLVDAGLRDRIEAVLGHRFSRLRVRYWDDGQTTAWVLDEIGKTEPITVAVAIGHGRVASVRILEFRESRGWEVRYPFFTDQFSGAGVAEGDRIDRSIDGITGATLSVNAVTRVVSLALILDAYVRSASGAASS
jgi:hypothetical protein